MLIRRCKHFSVVVYKSLSRKESPIRYLLSERGRMGPALMESPEFACFSTGTVLILPLTYNYNCRGLLSYYNCWGLSDNSVNLILPLTYTNGLAGICMFFDRDLFACLPKSARASPFPKSVKNHYFCSGPITITIRFLSDTFRFVSFSHLHATLRFLIAFSIRFSSFLH